MDTAYQASSFSVSKNLPSNQKKSQEKHTEYCIYKSIAVETFYEIVGFSICVGHTFPLNDLLHWPVKADLLKHCKKIFIRQIKSS